MTSGASFPPPAAGKPQGLAVQPEGEHLLDICDFSGGWMVDVLPLGRADDTFGWQSSTG